MKSKNIFILLFFFCLTSIVTNAQTSSNFGDTKTDQKFKPQKIGIVISSNDPETVWNAFRLANYSVNHGDTVSVFLLGKGVEAPAIVNKNFDVKAIIEAFSKNGGEIFACGTCLKSRNTEGLKLCAVSTLADLYVIIKSSDIVLTF
jgi:uncharacterized protein involved in oxidation of intracellular sulfur